MVLLLTSNGNHELTQFSTVSSLGTAGRHQVTLGGTVGTASFCPLPLLTALPNITGGWLHQVVVCAAAGATFWYQLMLDPVKLTTGCCPVLLVFLG